MVLAAIAAPATMVVVWWRIVTSADLNRRWNGAVHLLGISAGVLALLLFLCIGLMLEEKRTGCASIAAVGYMVYIAGILKYTVHKKRNARSILNAPMGTLSRRRRVAHKRAVRLRQHRERLLNKTAASIRAEQFSELPRSVHFLYRNSEGDIRLRQVDVYFCNQDRFHGFCYLRNQLRTFRFERVVGDVTDIASGQRMSALDWLAALSLKKENQLTQPRT